MTIGIVHRRGKTLGESHSSARGNTVGLCAQVCASFYGTLEVQ